MAGRKPGTSVKYTPEVLAQVLEMASRGVAEFEIAGALGVHRNTFIHHKNSVPELIATLEEARQMMIERAIGKACHIMFDDKHPKQWAALQLFLKSKCGWDVPKQVSISTIQPPSSITFELDEDDD